MELAWQKSKLLSKNGEAQVVEWMQEVMMVHPTWVYRRVWA